VNKTLKGLTAGAVLALAAGVAGVTSASAAPVTETTSFTYAAGSAELLVAASNLVPPKGTEVTIAIPLAETTQAAIAADVINTGAGLAAAGIPAADVAYGAVTATTTPVGFAEDVTVTLYVVTPKGNPANEFEVSGIAGGVAIAVPAGDTGTASVTWSKAAPPAPVARPHLTGGHVITVDNNDAQVGWKDGPGVRYVLTRTFGFDMTASNGDPHYGFTGGTTGYWGGLAAGHTYDIELIPAGANRQPLAGAQVGWITVVTTR
jgi:hypothetical protein